MNLSPPVPPQDLFKHHTHCTCMAWVHVSHLKNGNAAYNHWDTALFAGCSIATLLLRCGVIIREAPGILVSSPSIHFSQHHRICSGHCTTIVSVHGGWWAESLPAAILFLSQAFIFSHHQFQCRCRWSMSRLIFVRSNRLPPRAAVQNKMLYLMLCRIETIPLFTILCWTSH